MGIANKVAGGLGSLIFGAILLSGIDEVQDQLSQVSSDEKTELLNTMANGVITPYIVMAIVLIHIRSFDIEGTFTRYRSNGYRKQRRRIAEN